MAKQKAHTILLADDDEIVMSLLSSWLQESDYRVIACSQGEEAIAQCNVNTSIDLAILDQNMPGITGLQLARILWDQHAIPFILLTSEEDISLVDQAIGQGAFQFLSKPVKKDYFEIAIKVGLNAGQNYRTVIKNKKKNDIINVAIGILMATKHVDIDTARRMIKSQCQREQRSMHDYACSIIESFNGMLPAQGSQEQFAMNAFDRLLNACSMAGDSNDQ